MKARNRIFLIIGCVLAVAAVATTAIHLTRPIRIGVILPVSTPLGNEENLYVRYFRDTHPRIGLRPVVLVIENQVSDEEGIKAAFDRMEKQGVSAVVGGVISQEGVWLSERSAQTKVPTFGVTSSSSVLSGKKDAYFRLVSTNEPQAKAVAAHYASLGLERLVVLTSTRRPRSSTTSASSTSPPTS